MNLWAVYRVLVRLPPAMLVAVGLAELVASIMAWRAAEHVDIPGWETTFVGVCFGTPAFVWGALTLRGTWNATRKDFSATWFLLLPGAIALLMAITVIAVLAAVIADPSTYDNLRAEDGTIEITPDGFLFIGIFAWIVFAAGVAFPAYLYNVGITPEVRSKFDRAPDEYDAMADMLKGRRGPRIHR